MIDLIVKSLIIGTIAFFVVYYFGIKKSSFYGKFTKSKSFMLYLLFISVFILSQIVIEKIF